MSRSLALMNSALDCLQLEDVRRTFPAALSNQRLSYVFQSLLQEKIQQRQEINVRNLLQRLMCIEPGEGTD